MTLEDPIQITSIQVAIELWSAFFTSICAGATYLGRKDEPRRSDLLLSMLLVTTVLLVADAWALASEGYVTLMAFLAVRIGNFIVFASSPILIVIMAFYLWELIRTKSIEPKQHWTRAVLILGTVDLCVVILAQFTNLYYYFDERNVYHRTNTFWICTAFAVLLLLMLAIMVFQHFRDISKFEGISLLAYVFLPVFSSIYQMFHYGLSLNNIAAMISMTMIFMTHVVERSTRLIAQNEILMRKEIAISRQQLELSEKDAEIAQKKIQTSISQMQPHFVFNALGSIEQLCRTDAEEAAKATHQFARFLRSNLNALSSMELVSFSEELQHIRAYVWLEKMRFGDDLCFMEDVETESFHLPPLSVQPVVENCIKHGMMGSEDGVIHVVIRTREEKDAFVVIISDDGCGFDPRVKPKDNLVHVGLANVRERVEVMTKGSFAIQSAVGKGTTVTIRIPK